MGYSCKLVHGVCMIMRDYVCTVHTMALSCGLYDVFSPERLPNPNLNPEWQCRQLRDSEQFPRRCCVLGCGCEPSKMLCVQREVRCMQGEGMGSFGTHQGSLQHIHGLSCVLLYVLPLRISHSSRFRSFASLYVVILVLFRGIVGIDAFKPSPTDTVGGPHHDARDTSLHGHGLACLGFSKTSLWWNRAIMHKSWTAVYGETPVHEKHIMADRRQVESKILT